MSLGLFSSSRISRVEQLMQRARSNNWIIEKIEEKTLLFDYGDHLINIQLSAKKESFKQWIVEGLVNTVNNTPAQGLYIGLLNDITREENPLLHHADAQEQMFYHLPIPA